MFPRTLRAREGDGKAAIKGGEWKLCSPSGRKPSLRGQTGDSDRAGLGAEKEAKLRFRTHCPVRDSALFY